MKKNKTILCLGLTTLASLLVTACGPSEPAVTTYTLREAMLASPETWNVHSWKTNDDSVIMGYTEMGLFDFVMNETKTGYEVVPEMAASEAEDATATLTDEEITKFGLQKSEDGSKYTAGQKWVIKLNEAAKWADGTPINAQSYIDSMDRFLDPAMVNYRADQWYSGDVVLGNAEARFKSGRTVYEPRVDADGNFTKYEGTRVDQKDYGNLYVTLPWVGNMSISGLLTAVGGEALPKTAALLNDTNTWGTSASPKNVDLTTNTTARAAFKEAAAELSTTAFGTTLNENPRTEGSQDLHLEDFFLDAVKNKDVSFDNVGLVKSGDYEITLYLQRPCSLFQLHYQLSGNWLVKTDLYDANKSTVGDLTATKYGTSVDTYCAYGPYKLTKFQLDKEIHLTRNENWYGWTDGKHEGQFQTTDINIKIVNSEDTILQMFEKGEIDSVSLRSQDMAKYSLSSRVVYTPQTYSDKIALNSDFSSLKARQKEGTNKTILANKNFRKFLSWALDRETFVQTQTPGSAAALGVINSMYVADVETGELYRNTEAGKKVLTDVYGESKSGFDLAKAKEFLEKAVAEEKAAGNLKDTDKVSLEWSIYNEGWSTAIDYVIKNWTDATKGTSLEGKFEVKTNIDENLQDKMMAGQTDIVMDIWGGAEMNPYGIPDTWINQANRTCYGYNPDSETIEIDLNGDGKIDKATEIKSNTAWYNELNSGAYSAANAPTETRVKILAALEWYMLDNQYFIAQRARQSVSMNSYKVENGTDDYLQIVGFGGIRFLTHNKTDAQWAEFVKNPSNLDYTK